MFRTTTLVPLVAVAGVAFLCLAAVPAAAGVTAIVGTDDWPPFTPSPDNLGEFTCDQGEVVWDGFTPTCPDGYPLHWRGGQGISCVSSTALGGGPDGRFTGVLWMTFNANLDQTYSGRVWGDWTLVPSAACDPTVLDDPQSLWQGRWRGRRSLVCSGAGCSWLGAITYTGRGQGEGLRRLRFVGEETVQTFSPLPLPYEMLGLCVPGQPCPVEGHLLGLIRGR